MSVRTLCSPPIAVWMHQFLFPASELWWRRSPFFSPHSIFLQAYGDRYKVLSPTLALNLLLCGCAAVFFPTVNTHAFSIQKMIGKTWSAFPKKEHPCLSDPKKKNWLYFYPLTFTYLTFGPNAQPLPGTLLWWMPCFGVCIELSYGLH